MTARNMEEAIAAMGNRKCSNCLHGVFQRSTGRCHRNPPVPVMHASTGMSPPYQVTWEFPHVKDSDFCGQYERRG